MEHAPFFELKPNPMAIKSLYNTDQGLFPKGKSATENEQLVTRSLNLKEEDAVSPFPLLITSVCSSPSRVTLRTIMGCSLRLSSQMKPVNRLDSSSATATYAQLIAKVFSPKMNNNIFNL